MRSYAWVYWQPAGHAQSRLQPCPISRHTRWLAEQRSALLVQLADAPRHLSSAHPQLRVRPISPSEGMHGVQAAVPRLESAAEPVQPPAQLSEADAATVRRLCQAVSPDGALQVSECIHAECC